MREKKKACLYCRVAKDFQREPSSLDVQKGIKELPDAVNKKSIAVVLIKDALSNGRHNMASVFIVNLKSWNVEI